jgi:hypothetical protein
MIISMLEYYYDIIWKNEFENIFGHLEIGKNPTEERNTFLVFKISFSSLNTSSVDGFQRSMYNTINDSVKDFKEKYKNIFEKEIEAIILNENAIDSFSSLSNFVKNGKFRSKVIYSN